MLIISHFGPCSLVVKIAPICFDACHAQKHTRIHHTSTYTSAQLTTIHTGPYSYTTHTHIICEYMFAYKTLPSDDSFSTTVVKCSERKTQKALPGPQNKPYLPRYTLTTTHHKHILATMPTPCHEGYVITLATFAQNYHCMGILRGKFRGKFACSKRSFNYFVTKLSPSKYFGTKQLRAKLYGATIYHLRDTPQAKTPFPTLSHTIPHHTHTHTIAYLYTRQNIRTYTH